MIWALPTTRGTIVDVPGSHRSGGRTHTGYDIQVDVGTFVYSVSAGRVSHVVPYIDGNAGGRRVYVRNEDGSTSRYLHLSAVNVSVDDLVSLGEKLGRSGSSGPFADDDYLPHLHYERRDESDILLIPFGDNRLSLNFSLGTSWDIGLNEDEADTIAQEAEDARLAAEYDE